MFGKENNTTELSNLGSNTTEVECNESQAVWPLKQKDLNSTHTNCSSRDLPDGNWPGSLNIFRDSAEDNKNDTARPVIPDYNPPVSSRASNCLVLNQVELVKRSETSTGWRLFGIDLRNKNHLLPPPVKEVKDSCIAADSGKQAPAAVAELEDDRKQNPDLIKSATENKIFQLEAVQKETQSKQGSTASTRTRTKVQMQGVAVGRAVDLTSLEGYDDLITELEKMFEIKGELRARKKWEVVYTDDEGDMMLVGDDPWSEFCKMVKKMFIYTIEEVKKMTPRCRPIVPPLDGEGTRVSLDSELKSEA